MKRTHAEDENCSLAKHYKPEEAARDAAILMEHAVSEWKSQKINEPIQYTLSIDGGIGNFVLKPAGRVETDHMLDIVQIFHASVVDLSNFGLAKDIDAKAAAENRTLIPRKIIEAQIAEGSKKISCDFSNYELSNDDLQDLLTTLRLSDDALFSITLNHCAIDDDKIGILCEYLEKEDSVLELHLDHNRIGNAGFDCLAQVVMEISNIETISLRNNQIDDSALTDHVLGFFAVNKSLASLDLTDNQIITPEGQLAYKELQDIIAADPYATTSSGEESDDDLPALAASSASSGDDNGSSPDADSAIAKLGDTGHVDFIE